MSYKTEQRDALLIFLSEHAERQYTVHEIATDPALQSRVSESTVFRLIKEFVADGSVRRFAPGTGRRFFYQYVDGDRCGSHLHLKCTGCGKLFHLDGSVSDFMEKQILATNRFLLDEHQTMLFGTCAKCREVSCG